MALLSAAEAGLRNGEIEQLAERDPFSRFLPYRAYDAATQRYHNADNTIGLMRECRPVSFVGPKSLDTLAGMLRQEYPARTVLQWMLYPDDHVDDIVGQYSALKTRPGEVVQEASRRYGAHLREGRRGLAAMGGIPVRNFRLFFAIKSPVDLGNARVAAIDEALTQANLAPQPLPPGRFLDVMRRLFNPHQPANTQAYDEARYLRSQIVHAETPIEHEGDYIRIGGRYAACLTPKSLVSHEYLDVLSMNKLIGGYSGPQDDGSQLTHRFLWTTTVFNKTQAADIRRKASVMSAQRVGGTIAKEIGRRVSELSWVLDDMEKDRYVNVITSLWVFGDSIEDLDRGIARARGLWESQHFVMQRESKIACAMLIAALPFGLYDTGRNIETLDRDFTISCRAAAHLLPVQGDFAGRMRPVLLYIGRKGQLASIDVFDPGVNNHNYLVCAATGAGKSFQCNTIVNNYYATGALIRIIDIGYSYEKQCLLAGGRYIDVGAQVGKLCLNPFQRVGKGEDARFDELTTVNVLLAMAFSSTGVQDLTETHWSLMKDAVRFAIDRDEGLKGIDHVEEYLKAYPRFAGEQAFEGARPLAQEMAFNLRDFTSRGKYGTLFNGKSSLDLSSDDFVVLELEQLLHDQQLFHVVCAQGINAITQDLYLSDRTQRRFELFDECAHYMKAAPMIAAVIEVGYRRARKYGGSMGIVTQSPLDLRAFGAAGDVIKTNSAFKFFLESDDYVAAVKAGVLDYDGLLLELARSVRNNRPRYSEVLFDTPFGVGVGRLCVDRWTYWVNTSTASEVARFKSMLARGRSPREAIDQLASE